MTASRPRVSPAPALRWGGGSEPRGGAGTIGQYDPRDIAVEKRNALNEQGALIGWDS